MRSARAEGDNFKIVPLGDFRQSFFLTLHPRSPFGLLSADANKPLLLQCLFHGYPCRKSSGLLRCHRDKIDMEMGRCLGKIFQSCRRPFSVRRTASAVDHVADLEDCFMEQLFLFALPDMLVVVRYLISCFGFLCVVGCESFIKNHVIDLLQILVVENNVLLCPAPVYIRRREAAVVVPDAPCTCHARNRNSHKIAPLSAYSSVLYFIIFIINFR